MRDQYAGDISDYLKFAFLRSIVPAAARLGVAWYYLVGHDKRPGGRHLEYLDEDDWRVLDPQLYDALSGIKNNRSIRTLEMLPIWNNTTAFHRDAVEGGVRRAAWAAGMIEYLKDSDIVFADPDNGLSNEGVVHSKSATQGEVRTLSINGRPVVLIRFPSRRGTHDEQLDLYHKSLAALRPVTLKTCVSVQNKSGGKSPRIRWFTVMNASAEIQENIQKFQQRLVSIGVVKAKVVGIP